MGIGESSGEFSFRSLFGFLAGEMKGKAKIDKVGIALAIVRGRMAQIDCDSAKGVIPLWRARPRFGLRDGHPRSNGTKPKQGYHRHQAQKAAWPVIWLGGFGKMETRVLFFLSAPQGEEASDGKGGSDRDDCNDHRRIVICLASGKGVRDGCELDQPRFLAVHEVG